MKRQTLLLALVAGISLLGAREAVCQEPQRAPISRHNLQKPKVTVRPSIDDKLIQIVDDLEYFMAIVGPVGPVIPKPDPGPTFPEPEDYEDLMIEALINILLGEQYGLDSYDYDVPGSESKKPDYDKLPGNNKWEDGTEIIPTSPTMPKREPLLGEPAEKEGSDGDDIWDVLQGY